MKLLIIALLVSASCTAQTYLGMGTGVTAKKTPALELFVGQKINKIILQTGYLAHIDRRNPVSFNFLAGLELPTNGNTLQVTGGYAYLYKSSDHIDENVWAFIGMITYQIPMRRSPMYFQLAQSGQYTFLTFGTKFYFHGNK